MTPEQIIEAVSDVTGVSPQGLKGPSRGFVFSRPRHLAFFLMRDLLGLGSKHIGRAMDRDHTTVVYGVGRARRLLETNSAFREWHGKVLEKLTRARAA